MIARVESGSSPAQLDAVDFSQIASDVAELYQPVAEDAGFSFTTAIEPGIRVTGNRELLSRAAANLVDNALKYGMSDEGESRIGISLSKTGGRADLCVADRGPGIAQGDYSRAVERFSRLEETGTGSGLGLSLVNAIARLHGGTLELGSNDPGLRASIRIPLREGAAR
jgi:signal transduction histidine kinase